MLYKTLQVNLSNFLPAISTLLNFISTYKDNVVEGEYRFHELKDFLVKYNLPLCVWISENATRITGKIENDFISNTVVGFVMPFHDGLAKVFTFLSNSACAIRIYF